MTRSFPTVEEAVAIHDDLLAKFGGSTGLLDMRALESALLRPQMGYYDGLIQEAAALMESLAGNHPFVDGNKRVAFFVTDAFLRLNGSFIDCDSREAYGPLHAALRYEHVQVRGASFVAQGARQPIAGGLIAIGCRRVEATTTSAWRQPPTI